MTREWKPGDVAVLDDGLIAMRGDEGWVDRDGDYRVPEHDESARALLVIDPENRETIQTLADHFCRYPSDGWVEQMQAAVRAMLAPEPEEPTGLGAVVRGGDGRTWVRLQGSYPWIATGAGVEKWEDLQRPLTVLHAGWDADA